jgi:hypothetical protein
VLCLVLVRYWGPSGFLSQVLIPLVVLGHYHKVHKQQTFILSCFWRSEVQNECQDLVLSENQGRALPCLLPALLVASHPRCSST